MNNECGQTTSMLGRRGFLKAVGGATAGMTFFPDLTWGRDSDSPAAKIAVRDGAKVQKIVVENPTLSFRDGETVSLNFKDVKKGVAGLTKDNVAVLEFKTNRLLVTQVVGEGSSSELLFQTDMAPGEKKYFLVMKQPAGTIKPEPKAVTYCRFVPERKDDFAWENDKVAFRMYGPALEDETITCGIDAWAKCVSTPFIDKAFKSGNYHKNHGEGGDFYKVGNTLGCGGAAPLVDGKVCLSNHNFKEWKILENGPIRSVFEFTYAPWKAGTYTLSETKRISIDLGSNLNKIECFYLSDNAQTVPVAAGIVLQKSSEKFKDAKNNTIAYWLRASKYGMMGCGVIFAADVEPQIVEADNHLLMVEDHSISEPFVYYSGSCWDKNQEFSSFEKWQKYLENFKERIDNPVTIQFTD
jgi:hypothetical protein